MAIRNALRSRLRAAATREHDTVDEFWVPRSNERADLVLIGSSMEGFEIKSERDTLKRLPRQIGAYGRVFDRCSVVVAERHHEEVSAMVPGWWGITAVHVNGAVTFTETRPASPNPVLDPEIIVRLLWKDEARKALEEFGVQPDPRASRAALWRELLTVASLSQLRRSVRRALLEREPTKARTPTRRFTSPSPQAAR